ncbi:MAG: tetratricopeptide repeat protein [Pseudomonadota bacterium]
MTKEKTSHYLISRVRDLALIFGVISSLIGFGPQILESLHKLVEAKGLHALYTAYVNYGRELFESERYSDSTQSFEKALEIRPHDFSVQVWLKKAQLMDALDKLQDIKKEDISKLSFDVEFIIKSNPPDIYRYYYVQGNIRYILMDFKGAYESYEKSLKDKPDYGRALSNLGATFNELKEYDKAAKTLQAALESGYVNKEVYGNLCFALRNAGKNIDAVSIAQEGLKHFSTSAAIYNELGIALYRLSRLEASISALKTACIMTPKIEINLVVQRMTNIAYPLTDIGRTDEALSYLQQAKDLAPENMYIYLALAHFYTIAKDDVKTVEAYEKLGALGGYPDPDDLIKWALALERLKKTGEASRILSIALEVAIEKGQLKGVISSIKSLSIKLSDQQLLDRIFEIELTNGY